MIRHYARNGDEITMEQWGDLFGDLEYKRVGADYVGRYWVSTVWLGLDHGLGYSDRPLIFETMVFATDGGKVDSWAEEFTDRYSTEAEALAGHRHVVQMVQTLSEADASPATTEER